MYRAVPRLTEEHFWKVQACEVWNIMKFVRVGSTKAAQSTETVDWHKFLAVPYLA